MRGATADSAISLGLPVFPARLCDRACLKCDICKSPFPGSRGFKDATADPEAIKVLWQKYPGPLIGVPTGETSGFDALDIDRRHCEAVEWYRANRARLPRTRAHRTGSRGLHLLFKHHDAVNCTVSKIARGVDTRGSGGYIIFWPAAGLPVVSHAPLAHWPDWLLAEFRPKPQPASNQPTVRVPDNHFLAELVRMVAGAREGERNSLTFWCACRAGEMVASGLLSAASAIAVIAEAATRSGLPRKEAERTARSGIRTGGGYV
jgi:hypothetical protein